MSDPTGCADCPYATLRFNSGRGATTCDLGAGIVAYGREMPPTRPWQCPLDSPTPDRLTELRALLSAAAEADDRVREMVADAGGPRFYSRSASRGRYLARDQAVRAVVEGDVQSRAELCRELLAILDRLAEAERERDEARARLDALASICGIEVVSLTHRTPPTPREPDGSPPTA